MKSKLFVLSVVAALCVAFVASVDAQAQRKKKAPDKSQGASVSQTIGVDTEVTITYHRPGVRGRDVWTGKSGNAAIGSLVPRNGEPRPWRAGANEATTIAFSTDAKVEGQAIAAGTYSLFLIPTDGDWTVVFNNQATQWGSFRYDAAKDALRVDVAPADAPHNEWLMYGFDDAGEYSATAYMHWEKTKVSFKIEVEAAN